MSVNDKREEIREIVHQVLLEDRGNVKLRSRLMHRHAQDSVGHPDIVLAFTTTNAIRTSQRIFGICDAGAFGAERVQGIGLTAIITMLVGGVVSALVLGVKAMIGK